ncbi:hypothetical protein O181_023844 [Austropuccinia psidii MF-1]|uniref:Uncharacterized protein n=1 Tax=Austropuccinia psidii MF-1 TaxID=1389203 RepID=A0A9Q3CHH0_9BASI|nr:hypothetical protein [Austropuccinia psidii MF-1]
MKEESTSSKKILTLAEELEKEKSEIEESGEEESSEKDFSYFKKDEEFLQKVMEIEAKRHGKKAKQTQPSPEATTEDDIIERILRPQPPSPTPNQKSFSKSTPGNLKRSGRRARRVKITTPDLSPERVAIPSRRIVKIKAEYYNLDFDDSYVEDFIKRSERRAAIE